MKYDIGDMRRVTCRFYAGDTGVLTDPSVVELHLRWAGEDEIVSHTFDPSPHDLGATDQLADELGTAVVIGNGLVRRQSRGIYTADVEFLRSGRLHVRWEGEGAVVTAEETALDIRPSAVLGR